MTREDMTLLEKDLCARLPYGVKGVVPHTDEDSGEPVDIVGDLRGIDYNGRVYFFYPEQEGCFNMFEIESVRLCLRPLSDMTEGEKAELAGLTEGRIICNTYNDVTTVVNRMKFPQSYWCTNVGDWLKVVAFLDSHHFDHRGLIARGLAVEAAEGIYDNNQKQLI